MKSVKCLRISNLLMLGIIVVRILEVKRLRLSQKEAVIQRHAVSDRAERLTQ